MAAARSERSTLRQLVATWKELAAGYPQIAFLQSEGPIQGVIVPGNRAAVALEEGLRELGFFVRAIRSPTVPVGLERLRVCLHSFNRVPQLSDMMSFIAHRLGSREALCASVG
jgi:8-amino-7-oxononanoate synthase